MSISDTGIGISANALPFIFEPFVQDNHAVGFNGAGLGIGLTVVRELVEAHGGTVTGKSEGYGKGSEFVVTLPLVGYPEKTRAILTVQIEPRLPKPQAQRSSSVRSNLATWPCL